MGKKGNWFSAVKKALSQDGKDKKDQKTKKSKKIRFRKNESIDVISFLEQSPLDVLGQPPTIEDVGGTEVDVDQAKHACPMAAEVAAAQPFFEDVQLPGISCPSGMSKEEIAAIKIQTAFRGHMARRALSALKGLVRLKSWVQGQSVQQQVASTLKSLQTIVHAHSEIRARRIRMSKVNQDLQRHLQQKRERELEKLRASMDEQWDDSTHSKAEIQAKLLKKHEAAVRREKALAYAFSHQQTWKDSSKTSTPSLMDPNNPHWGWSWLESWMVARPQEARYTGDCQDHGSVESVASCAPVGDEAKVYAPRVIRCNEPSPRTPPSKKSTPKALSSSSGEKKTKSAGPGGDGDSRSKPSVKSASHRRHSIAGLSISDKESLVSSPSAPSYLTPKKVTNARPRLSNPSTTEKKCATNSLSRSSGTEKKGTTERGSAGFTKKRLSFTAPQAQPRTRGHSSPPSLEAS